MLLQNNYELNDLSGKIKAKGLIIKSSILNGAKYFSLGIFQNYLVFVLAKVYIKYLLTLLGLICGNLMECQKKILRQHFCTNFC